MPAKLSDIELAFEFASAGDECAAYVCRQTGEIYYVGGDQYSGEPDDEVPDDIDDGSKYAAVPGKRELDLGKPMVLAFAREVLPEDFNEIRDIFSKRGAYQKFKGLLDRRGAIDRWHAFENETTRAALRAWCEAEAIELEG
jgi:hypothetical protein